MSRARPKPPAARSKQPLPGDSPPDVPPPRRHPWLLALSVVLLSAWLVFMAYLAWGH